MKLVSMKMSKADKKEPTSQCVPGDAPNYPYGLQLRLDSATLEKLGIKTLPAVGIAMQITAVGSVTSVSSHESERSDSRTVEIQIEELAIAEEEPQEEIQSIVKYRR